MNKVKDFIYENYENSITADGYWSPIKVFIEKNINNDLDAFDIINNELYVKKHLDNYFIDKELSTKQKFVSSLYSVYKKYIEKDIDINDNLFNYIKEEFKILSDKCNSNNINKIVKTKYNYTDLYNYFLKMEVNTPEYVFMATIIYLPCRRLDWEHAFFIKENDFNPNFINKEKYNFVIINNDNTISLEFYNFKTKKILGPYKRKLINSEFTYLDKVKEYSYFNPEKFSDILINYYKLNIGQRFVLTDKFNGFSKGTFSNWVKRGPLKTFGLTAKDIRYICISTIMNNAGLYMTTAEKKEFAFDMGQKSLETQDTYREVPDIEENISDDEEFIEEYPMRNDKNIETNDCSIQTDNQEIETFENLLQNNIVEIKIKNKIKEYEEQIKKLKIALEICKDL